MVTRSINDRLGPGGLTSVAVYSEDASGNVTGLILPDGNEFNLRGDWMTTAVIFGDSMTAQNNVTSDTLISYSDKGFFVWANAYLGQRFKLLANAGMGGDTTALMLARLDADVIALSPGWCFVLGGFNDINNGVAVATIISNLTSIYSKLIGAGIRVVAISILPSSTFTTTAKKETVAQLNRWMRWYTARTQGVVFVDAYTPLLDPTSAVGAHVTAYLTDTIHPSTSGAQRIGKAIYNELNAITPPAQFPQSIADNVSIAWPYGNIITNPVMQGTGGNAQAGTSGTIAANWNAIREDASSTTVLSKVARTDYPHLEWQQLAITQGSAAAAIVDLYKSFTLPAGVAVGDVVYGQAELVASDLVTTTLSDLKIYIQATGGSGVVTAYGMGNNNGSILADGNILFLRTPDFTIPAGTTALVFTIQAKLAGIGTMTLKVGRTELRRVFA